MHASGCVLRPECCAGCTRSCQPALAHRVSAQIEDAQDVINNAKKQLKRIVDLVKDGVAVRHPRLPNRSNHTARNRQK